MNFSIIHLSSRGPVEIVKSGIVMSPEGRRIFPHLTVLEVGAIVLQGTGEQLIAADRVRSAYLGG